MEMIDSVHLPQLRTSVLSAFVPMPLNRGIVFAVRASIPVDDDLRPVFFYTVAIVVWEADYVIESSH